MAEDCCYDTDVILECVYSRDILHLAYVDNQPEIDCRTAVSTCLQQIAFPFKNFVTHTHKKEDVLFYGTSC